MDTRPFDSWLEVSSGAAASPFRTVGAERALSLPTGLGAELASEADAAATGPALGAFRPTVPGGPKTDTGPARRRIAAAIDDAFFRAADVISDALAFQFLAIAEQGELLARWKNVYGIVRDSADPNARCGR